MKPSPTILQETNELWNWDVAEVFISSDFNDIKHYQEFEVSPQGEWIDLDIDLRTPHHEDGWTWNSGFVVSARTDARNHRPVSWPRHLAGLLLGCPLYHERKGQLLA